MAASTAKHVHGSCLSRSMENPLTAQACFQQHLPEYIRSATDCKNLVGCNRANTSLQLEQKAKDIAYREKLQVQSTVLLCAERNSEEDITIPDSPIQCTGAVGKAQESKGKVYKCKNVTLPKAKQVVQELAT